MLWVVAVRIGVVDYTVGNLGSLLAALKRAGAEPVVVNEPEEANRVDAIVLPGVGAYDAAAAKARSFKRVIESKPTLAICLGMEAPSVTPLAKGDVYEVFSVVPEDELPDIVIRLKEAGAKDIVVTPIEKLIS